MATLESFDEAQWQTLEYNSEIEGSPSINPPNNSTKNGHQRKSSSEKPQAKSIYRGKRNFLVKEENIPNEYVNWKPIVKRKQNLIINETSTLIMVVETETGLNKSDKSDLEEPIINKTKDDKPNDSSKIPNLDKAQNINKPYEDVKIDKENLTKAQLKEVEMLLERKAQVFALKNCAPSKAINVTHSINTGNSPPIHVPKYRTSHKERPIIVEHIKDMLEKKVIEPSRSPWASPIVLVPKKDGTIRFCVDYRKLNSFLCFTSY